LRDPPGRFGDYVEGVVGTWMREAEEGFSQADVSEADLRIRAKRSVEMWLNWRPAWEGGPRREGKS
jgi:hypothetical protein